ncbi:MAG: DUF5069 domain-containing protein [Verrucomicrobiota bacterium]
MEKLIPLISSDTEGPLGVKHLPRLWLKARLAASGRLPEGYKVIQPTFDTLVLEALKIDLEQARTYLLEQRPSYLEFEAWLRQQPGVDLSPGTIAEINRRIVERKKSPESCQRMLADIGLPTDTPIEQGVLLNNLDDWTTLHNSLS